MAVLTEEPIPFGMAVTECMGTPILASLTGFVRGLIRDGYQVPQGFKIADIDPQDDERENCFYDFRQGPQPRRRRPDGPCSGWGRGNFREDESE